VRPSRETPTQNKVVVKRQTDREREREREIKQLNTWKRVISASLKAFTPSPYRDDSTTANLNTAKHVILHRRTSVCF
jgi:hypothetical protein